MKKVNIGCGTTIVTGWTNIDNSFNIVLSKFPLFKKILYKLHILPKSVYYTHFPSNVIHHNVTRGLPFNSNSVGYIYSSHLLEHLTRTDSQKLLTECHRVLKKGGKLRLIVPDLKLLATKYVNDVINADEFMYSIKLKDSEKKKTLGEKLFPSFFLKDIHKWMFDFESLSILLKFIGFEKVEKLNFQEGSVPDIEILDNRPDQSLFLEAKK